MRSHNRCGAHPLRLIALAVPSLAGGASYAQEVFYSNDFERGETYAEWSNNQRYTDRDVFTRFLGRYTNHQATLTLQAPPVPRDMAPIGGGDGDEPPGAPAARPYLLEFDFYCIDSWDGNEPTNGADHFGVRLNNVMIFDHTFANQHLWQSYPGAPALGRAELGFDGRWNDSIYHLAIPFETDAATLRFDFLAYGLHGAMGDESWGIDNIRISALPVPAPAAASLLGVGGVLALRRRR